MKLRPGRDCPLDYRLAADAFAGPALFVEAVPLVYDHLAFLAEFDRQWPPHSSAARAYRARLLEGAADLPNEALLGGFQRCQPTPVQDVCCS
jgi:hypothetical protein